MQDHCAATKEIIDRYAFTIASSSSTTVDEIYDAHRIFL